MAAYLDAWFEEAPEEAAGIARVLERCRLPRGMTQVARDAAYAWSEGSSSKRGRTVPVIRIGAVVR